MPLHPREPEVREDDFTLFIVFPFSSAQVGWGGEGDGLSLMAIYKNTFGGGLRLTWRWKPDEYVLSATPETEHRQMGLDLRWKSLV